MSRQRWTWALVMSLGAATSTPAVAQSPVAIDAVAIDEGQAVRTALEHNPSLRAALLDEASAAETIDAEDHRFVPRIALDATYTHTESPNAALDGSVTTSQTDGLVLGSDLSHTFPWGTSFTLRLQQTLARTLVQPTAVSSELLTLGPTYGLSTRLSVVQPLMRGFGRDVGEAAWRQAKLSRTATERARDQVASVLLRDVTLAYWELWYVSRAVEIERAAAALAGHRREQTKAQIEQGGKAPMELFQFETRVAELSQSVLVAEGQRRQQAVSLLALLGDDRRADQDLAAAPAEPPLADGVPDRRRTRERAVARSMELAQLEAQLAVSLDQAAIAGEAERPRVDLQGFVQAQGLGNQSIPPAYEQLGTLGAVSGQVGLSVELPVTGERRRAQRRSADASAEASRERIHARRQQLEASVDAQLVSLATAQRRVELAERAAAVAERQVEAQQARYDEGAGIALEIRDAEDSLRRARLSAERARVDALRAQIELDHLSGELLLRYRHLVPASAGAARASGAVLRLGVGRF